MSRTGEVSRLLKRMRGGDRDAASELLPLVYAELQRLAHSRMQGERRGHTLQPTALVHETYLRLMGHEEATWENRAHFFGAATIAMRRILVEHARTFSSRKGEGDPVNSPEIELPDSEIAKNLPGRVIAVHEALTKFAKEHSRKAQLVELRFFVGLGLRETAELLGVSVRTATRDWNYAKAWLYREVQSSQDRADS